MPARIELTRLHAEQEQVKREAVRFNVVCCGWRWGKSTLGSQRTRRARKQFRRTKR